MAKDNSETQQDTPNFKFRPKWKFKTSSNDSYPSSTALQQILHATWKATCEMYRLYSQDISNRRVLQGMVIRMLAEKFKILKEIIHERRIEIFEMEQQRAKLDEKIQRSNTKAIEELNKGENLREQIFQWQIKQSPKQQTPLIDNIGEVNEQVKSLERDVAKLKTRQEKLQQKFQHVQRGIELEKQRQMSARRTQNHNESLATLNTALSNELKFIEQEIQLTRERSTEEKKPVTPLQIKKGNVSLN